MLTSCYEGQRFDPRLHEVLFFPKLPPTSLIIYKHHFSGGWRNIPVMLYILTFGLVKNYNSALADDLIKLI